MGRDINALAPDVAALCLLLIDKAALAGIRIRVVSTRRTEVEQAALYAQGREDLGAVNYLRGRAGLPSISAKENSYRVTNARTSVHQTGRAFDIVVIHPKGYMDWENTEAFGQVGEIGKSLGLYWGGDFKSIKGDLGHFQGEPPK